MSVFRSVMSGGGVRARAGLLLCVASGVLMAGSPAAGQQDAVKFSLRLAPGVAAVAPGAAFRVQLVATMGEGWHLYSTTQPPGGPIATRITVSKGQIVTLDGKIEAPAPQVSFDQNFGMDTELFEGEVTFVLPLRVAADATPGPHTIAVETYFQACNDQVCLPPRTVKSAVEMVVAGAALAGAPAGSTAALVTAAPAAAATVERTAPAGGARMATTPESPAASVARPAESRRPDSAAPDTARAEAVAGPEVAQSAAPSVAPAPAPVAAVPPGAAQGADAEGPAGAQSLWSFLWLAITMGALALLTPCVFPMIPVTVSYFTSQAAGSRKKAVGQALTYMAGIVLTFTALGMAMALLVGATSLSRFAASPWLNVVLGALFVAFAFSLFGFYEIQVPSAVLSKLDAATRRTGGGHIVGTLLMALTFTLTSISCTAPFVGTLLVMAAAGSWQWPLVGMLAFSTVLAFPFFLLALAPQLLASLPRSGGWMSAVKVMLGFLVVAASTKFFSSADTVWGWGLLTRDVVLGSWIAVGLLMMAYVLGLFRFQHDSPVKHVGVVRLATALVCGTLAFWLASGLGGRPLGELDALLPLASPAAGPAAGTSGAGGLGWLVNDYEGALAEARRSGRRVFLDFTGYTCTNCKWMETNMFPRDEVRRELERFVRVRLYTDGEGELYQRFQRLQEEKFKTVAVPYYAVVEPDGTTVGTFAGLTRDSGQFVRFLKQAQAAPGLLP